MRRSVFTNVKPYNPSHFWRFLGQPLCALALGLMLLLANSPDLATAAPRQAVRAEPSHHVYCIRGFMSIFSLGMDDLCNQLEKMGINASVHSHVFWSMIANDAAANYKSGRAKTIILIGHSLGAKAVADITDELGSLGVPVRLAVELDPVSENIASGQVNQFINYYISSGVGKTVSKGPRFKGSLTNVDVSKVYPEIIHLNIDKLPAMHERLIGEVRRALNADRRPIPDKPSTTPTASQHAVRAAAKAPQ